MNNVSIDQIMAEQEAKRKAVLTASDRGKSAYHLANLSLKHSSAGGFAAATLLLAMEQGIPFNFKWLLSFDSENRAHADVVLQGYKAHDIWPSRWMDKAGYQGADVMNTVRDKWWDNIFLGESA